MTSPPRPSQQKVSYAFSKLYESHQYFSPYKMSTEEQLIDEIQSLGDEILYFQDESDIIQQQQELESLIRGYRGSLERKSTKVKNSDRVRKDNSPAKNKAKTNRKTSPQFPKNYFQPKIPKREILTTKFLRQKTVEKLNRSKEQKIKAALTKSPIKPKPQTPKLKPSKKNSQSPKFLENLQYDYNKFIHKNLPKIVNELKYQKEVLQLSNGQRFNGSKKQVTGNNMLVQSHRSKEKSIYTEQNSLVCSRQKLNQTFSTLYTNSRTMLQKKQQKIQNYKQEMFKKQMQEATFEPKRFTHSYKSKNSYVAQNSSLKNFYQRQKMINETKNKRQLQKLSEIMEECPFKPRLNVNSRNAESIVKEIWRSTSKESKIQGKKQTEQISDKLQRKTNGLKKEHQRQSQARIQQERFKKQTVQISMSSRNELNFLLE